MAEALQSLLQRANCVCAATPKPMGPPMSYYSCDLLSANSPVLAAFSSISTLFTAIIQRLDGDFWARLIRADVLYITCAFRQSNP